MTLCWARGRVPSIVKKRVIEALATCLYIGKLPVAPGTFGTFWGVPVVFLFAQGSPYFYLFASIALILGASVVAHFHELYTAAHDPGEIVLDEVVGYVIAMTWLPLTWQSLLGAFIVFRFFDILKPYPISYIDRKVEGGLGTVLDDVAAGLAANIVLQIVLTQTSWLGVKLSGF